MPEGHPLSNGRRSMLVTNQPGRRCQSSGTGVDISGPWSKFRLACNRLAAASSGSCSRQVACRYRRRLVCADAVERSSAHQPIGV